LRGHTKKGKSMGADPKQVPGPEKKKRRICLPICSGRGVTKGPGKRLEAHKDSEYLLDKKKGSGGVTAKP